jgi:hypothetical protein
VLLLRVFYDAFCHYVILEICIRYVSYVHELSALIQKGNLEESIIVLTYDNVFVRNISTLNFRLYLLFVY